MEKKTSKIISSEIKTIYTVEVSFNDLAEAKSDWIFNVNGYRTLYPKAFDNEDTTLGVLKKEFEEFRPYGDRTALMADYLGFDGWNNALFYHENTKTLTMVVYHRGSRIGGI